MRQIQHQNHKQTKPLPKMATATIFGCVQLTTQGINGPWSEAQRVWIETAAPKITLGSNSNTTWAKTGSVTVTLQDSKSGLAAGASVKYGWSTSTSTEPEKYTVASLNYTAGTTSAVTFKAEASGLTGKYYLWVVPTILKDTAGNSQTTTAKSTGQFYFDNKGPSAPTITGGGTNWATSRTISVSTASTDANVGKVANYEYYRTNSTTAPNASTTATASLSAGTTSVTFNTNFNAYYVYFRAVDSLGNKGDWSAAQRLYIDINKPTVTAKQATLTITQGQSYAFKDYFTVEANGANTNITTTYKIGSTAYTNTSSLAVGTHTVTCTATKTGGNSNTATMTVVVGKPLVTTATSIQSATTEYQDAKGNKIVVPGGFKVRTDLATTVDKGIVIEDSDGNQFVWVPIGTITKADGSTVTIDLGRYSNFSLTATPAQKASAYTSTVTINSYYQETPSYRQSTFTEVSNSNATAKDLATFITKTQNNGGYYLARYEASFGSGSKISSVSNGTKGVTSQKPAFKKSTSASNSSNMGTVTSTPGMLWNYIRQGDASLACQNLYAGNEYNSKNFVESDLVNSYAWDTAIMFIQKCSSKTTYYNQTDGNGTLKNTGATSDVVCNIYDMAGNVSEWTTETTTRTSSYHRYGTTRGGAAFNRAAGYNTSNRASLENMQNAGPEFRFSRSYVDNINKFVWQYLDDIKRRCYNFIKKLIGR